MPFTSRNAFYLRISNSMVLPTYIYLDERHIQWMSDTILQFVLSDLRPHLLSKLKAEADIVLGGNASKKSTVDTHRGETYQFCYFLRKTDPHSVIVKSRSFRAVQTSPTQRGLEHPPRATHNRKGKRKENPIRSHGPVQRTRRKRARVNDEAENTFEESGEDVNMNGSQNDTIILCHSPDDDYPMEDTSHLDVEEEEEKPKPALSLRYRGFNIYGHCLCVVIEPWPVVRTVTSDVAPIFKSTTGPPKSSHAQAPAEPLFLADEEADDEDSISIPANTGQFINTSYLQQVLDHDEVEADEVDTGGMLEFSQVLQNIGDSRAGVMNDNDDMDGSVMFGDADEQREL